MVSGIPDSKGEFFVKLLYDVLQGKQERGWSEEILE